VSNFAQTLASLLPFLKGMFNIPTWLIHQVIFATLAGQNRHPDGKKLLCYAQLGTLSVTIGLSGVGPPPTLTRRSEMRRSSAAMARKPRVDAVRNRERVLEAAKAVFSAGGSDASLEAVARRAGVGLGRSIVTFRPARRHLLK
jgi:hypothetical protein